jgi:hypothetical protein
MAMIDLLALALLASSVALAAGGAGTLSGRRRRR